MPEPTSKQIGMYDMDGNKKLDWSDHSIASSAGYHDIARTIKDILETGTGVMDWNVTSGEVAGGATTEVLQELIDSATTVQTQPTSPVVANPLPSLPSISNVGAQSFSGAVNTQAIPGGFQPLPQIAGTSKKLYQLSQFHGGINQRFSPRDISDQECQEASNVTFSQVGTIKLLGDCLNTNNSIEAAGSPTTDRGKSGYGLFQFSAPSGADGNVGDGSYDITLFPDGDKIDYHDSHDDGTGLFIDYNGAKDNHDVAHVIYAAGSGVYANDANFEHGSGQNPRMAAIYVAKNHTQTGSAAKRIEGWTSGYALIRSPIRGGSNAAGYVFLDVDVDNNTLAFTKAAAAGSVNVHIGSNDTAGTWGASGGTAYTFYISWLFDGGVETGLTSLGTASFAEESLFFNFSFESTWNKEEFAEDPQDITNCKHVGLDFDDSYAIGNIRIDGARIYFKDPRSAERWLLAEVDLQNGVKGAVDSTYTAWAEDELTHGGTYYLGADLEDNALQFENPPEIHSYLSLNGYYAEEVYSSSPDAIGSRPSQEDVRYKAAVMGSNGSVFIANASFKGRLYLDSMFYSMPGKPGVFPRLNQFDSPSSDGSPINALASFQDKILQFKNNAMYVINISNPTQYYAEASFRDCGVMNPCQVFTTSFGVIFANKHGCFIYDGSKVISLTGGKFDVADWGLVETNVFATADASYIPCVGYDPRSQSIIVLKDIGHTHDNDDAWVYNMITQSWTEALDMIANGNGDRFSNFIITSSGYLSILNFDETDLHNYNHDMQTDNNSTASAQTITYITKDIDFGLPSQTKKIFKVYLTYKGDADALAVYFRADGNTTDRQFTSVAVGASNTPLTDVASTLTTVALTPTTASQAKDIKSFALKFTGSVGVDAADAFEINDISILYRVRPIK